MWVFFKISQIFTENLFQGECIVKFIGLEVAKTATNLSYFSQTTTTSSILQFVVKTIAKVLLRIEHNDFYVWSAMKNLQWEKIIIPTRRARQAAGQRPAEAGAAAFSKKSHDKM